MYVLIELKFSIVGIGRTYVSPFFFFFEKL